MTHPALKWHQDRANLGSISVVRGTFGSCGRVPEVLVRWRR